MSFSKTHIIEFKILSFIIKRLLSTEVIQSDNSLFLLILIHGENFSLLSISICHYHTKAFHKIHSSKG